MDERLHIFGIRHHGPGSAALLKRALDALNPSSVLIEGPPEADELIAFAGAAGMRPPIALMVHATADANAAFFSPFAEFSPEWQAIQWALVHGKRVRFIDWPGGIRIHELLAAKDKDPDEMEVQSDSDPLDLLAEAAGFTDGEALWNGLIEQGRLGRSAEADGDVDALAVFAAIERAMTEVRAESEGTRSERSRSRDVQREAWMRLHICQTLKECDGVVAVVVGAWHVSALRERTTLAADKALVKDLLREKVEVTWVPWTNSRLSALSGYGAGVLSPGWYRHLWSLYSRDMSTAPAEFAAQWQAKTAALLRQEGYPASTASAIEAARLCLTLAALRERLLTGVDEMREWALAVFC
jgi:hypothetical protein